ncbi:MAG: LPS export ABC transporter periplasmic protein LptC [Paludibacteraceae bacterium]|nr:LPS export ABC transporter periplasmic protein LptC [Paludibacteraceae bacterium]
MKRPLFDNSIIASALVVLAILFAACDRDSVQQSKETLPREQIPALVTDSVTTLISDSGITRYRIEAPQWLVFDKTTPPHQEFPTGIYLEQFDEDLSVQASLKADYAYYDEEAQIWTLKGNVHALNRKGEQFDTPELHWNQKEHRVYSDEFIHITREKSIIDGVGFESNEDMSKYTILHPTGVFPIDDEEKSEAPAEQQTITEQHVISQ